jgi:ubiquinone/menaquinone biosynthesis C-methylase UbiE
MEISCERMTPGHFPVDVELEHFLRYAYLKPFVAGKDVADIACGSGYGSKLLADAGARSVVGMDLDQDAIDYARRHYPADNLHFETGNAENLANLPDASFDMVVSFETIEHLNHVEDYLVEVRRILRPGGDYIVSTPDRRLASTLYPLRGRPNNPFHVREFTRAELLQLLGEYFQVSECLGQAYIHPLLVFWPLQVFLKASCYAFQRLGAYRAVRRIYHYGSGFEVRQEAPGRGNVARFWVVRCRKL